jgi:hypothetical protein
LKEILFTHVVDEISCFFRINPFIPASGALPSGISLQTGIVKVALQVQGSIWLQPELGELKKYVKMKKGKANQNAIFACSKGKIEVAAANV